MISIIAALAGILGMTALWCAAWLILRSTRNPKSLDEQPGRRRLWRNEPTDERTVALPPPGWVLDPNHDAGAFPDPRPRPSSGANTVCFHRGDLDLDPEAPAGDETALWPDEQPRSPATTSLLTGLRPPERE